MPFELKNRTSSGKIVAGLASPSPASNEGSCCKENININKSETSKLNMEPLQMKRKKRGGGYNLRKSLAWDRAFFTEQGVLDPLELSMITGASRRELPVIDEGAPGGSQPTTEPLDLQQLENYQLKVLKNEGLSEERIRDCFSAKAHSSSSKLASHKVSTRFGRKSVSRYGESPHPVPSSSLKRPATVNAGKAAAKGLKLPKVPGSVTRFSSIRATKSSTLRVNHLKHNQITQPGSKISLKSHKNKTATKHSSSQPTCHPELNSGTSSVNRYSSANTSLPLGDNACSSGSKNIAANVNPSSMLHSSESRDQLATFSASFSQIAQSSGRITHLSQNQNMKPSGLRMPSPSLSFFCQPKSSASNRLSSRDADIDACGSQKSGNSRLGDKMIRIPEIVDNITESIKSNSTSICHRSRRFMPSTADVLGDALNIEKMCDTLVENYKSIDGQTDYLFDEKGNNRTISLENVDFLKVDYEIRPQIDNCELEINDENFQVANHSCTVESLSRGSGRRNLETTADDNNEIHKSDAKKAVDEPCQEQITFDVSTTNSDADFGTHLEDETYYKGQKSKMMQGGCKDTCKPDCCKPFMALIDELEYPPIEIDKRCVETMERAIEIVGLSGLQRSSCDEGATSEALNHRPTNVRSSDFGSDCQDEKADSIDVIDDKLQAGEAHIQDTIFALPIPDSKNKVNLVPEFGDDIKESGKASLIQDDCLRVELDSPITDEYHTSYGLFSEKRTYFRKFQQEEIVETHPSVGLDRNDRNKLNETNMDSHQTLVEKHDCNSDKAEVIEQSLTDAEVDFVGNSPISIHKTSNLDGIYVCKASYFEVDIPSRETMQSEVSANGSGDDGNYLRNGKSEKVLLLDPANGNMSEVLYLDNGTTDIELCSSFPKTNDHEVSKNMYNEVTKPMPLIKDDCQINREGSSLSPQEGGFDIDNQRNISDSRNMLAQPPETNKLNECCIERWEHLELPKFQSEEEKILCTNDGLHIKNRLQNQRTASDESLEDDSLGSIFATVSGSNVMHFDAVKNTSISAKELSLKSECCNVSNGTGGRSSFVDAITDPASIEPFSDDNTIDFHQETINSIHELRPNSDHDKAKSALATNNNKYGVGHNGKSHPCILSPSTIAFSDEWLAAIEAAGEQILTKKGGAVQNSPPDKLLPEPSPWSPVKKNNQIGPFDCTKFSNNLH
ncbi:uncharacterized protein LOC142549105 isoform X3 [Primulina tabacum]|uniref:uncharacterized protein LOC142549105 isoform X3 n=1 Tax=Primulina tabacum TaxID=48773 RepID=UPI003F5A4F94